MKHMVVMDGLKGSDIRPPALLSKFRELSIKESSNYFGNPARLVSIPCPACDSSVYLPVFVKNGFQYNRCSECASVFVSPRPTHEALVRYYNSSKAGKFRVDYFSRKTEESRRIHVLRSRVNWLGRIVDGVNNGGTGGFGDIGTNYPVIFDEVKKLDLFDGFYSIRPSPGMEGYIVNKKARVSQDNPTGLGALTAFEQLEHEYSPYDYIKDAYDMLSDNGVFFLTTRTISGFDLQVLWEKASYIFVPEHLNLLSIKGITKLFTRCGLDLMEISTPGQLDVELVLHAIKEDSSIKLPSFIDYILRSCSTETHNDLQQFLQRNRLSSHLRIAARKGGKND
jgi:hypothetical protein